MVWLRKNFKVLFSPIFWGWTLAAIVEIGISAGWWDSGIADILFKWIVAVTGTGTVLKFGKKVAGN